MGCREALSLIKSLGKRIHINCRKLKKTLGGKFLKIKNNLSKDEKTLKLAIETILDISRKLTTLYHLRPPKT